MTLSQSGDTAIDIPLPVGYKHREWPYDPFGRGGKTECGVADSPEEAFWVHGMHAVVGFLP